MFRGRTRQNNTKARVMNRKFDELAKGLAQSVTRRAALRKFSVRLAGMALACFGLAHKTEATQTQGCLPLGSKCGSDKGMLQR